MALKNVFLSLTIITCFFMTNAATARELTVKPGYNLAARLEASEVGVVECFNALLEIKSCANDIISFFLNGQTDIGAGCCRAITVVTHNCLPTMLTSLGFTAEEGNILQGYCDTSAGPVVSPPFVSSPVQSPPLVAPAKLPPLVGSPVQSPPLVGSPVQSPSSAR